MNKKITFLLSFLAILLICFFSLNIFKRFYFNEFLYEVPDLKNFSLKEATDVLKKNGLNIKDMGEQYSSEPVGTVFLQEPLPKSIVKRGRNIKVWTSKGTSLVEVENLVGMNFLDAKSIATRKGLVIDRVSTVSTNVAYNTVLATEPPTNDLLSVGEKISFLINVSDGSNLVSMPDLVGYSLDEAKDLLKNKFFIIRDIKKVKINDFESNIIISTKPIAGEHVPNNSFVDIEISE